MLFGVLGFIYAVSAEGNEIEQEVKQREQKIEAIKEEEEAGDKISITLKAPWVPLYHIGGKTVMPFGVFEDHLIEGTLTEDLYEIDELGATIGFAPDFFGLESPFRSMKTPVSFKT